MNIPDNVQVDMWYIARGSKQHGPVTKATIEKNWYSGHVRKDDMVFSFCTGAWIPIDQCEEFTHLFPKIPQFEEKVVAEQTPVNRVGKKIKAATIALAGLGIACILTVLIIEYNKVEVIELGQPIYLKNGLALWFESCKQENRILYKQTEIFDRFAIDRSNWRSYNCTSVIYKVSNFKSDNIKREFWDPVGAFLRDDSGKVYHRETDIGYIAEDNGLAVEVNYATERIGEGTVTRLLMFPRINDNSKTFSLDMNIEGRNIRLQGHVNTKSTVEDYGAKYGYVKNNQ